MQVVFSKVDKHEGMKGQKLWLFTHFITYIFARTERKTEPLCKIKSIILVLSWGVFELVSSSVREFMSW